MLMGNKTNKKNDKSITQSPEYESAITLLSSASLKLESEEGDGARDLNLHVLP